MTKTKHLAAACLVALATICLCPDKITAQTTYGTGSPPIEMVANSGTTIEQWQTSQSGNFAPVGLRPGEQTPITLILSSSSAGHPVGIAPLDGGEIVAAPNLSVTTDGTLAFNFKGGNTPGLYRVLVTIASQQYFLRFYVIKQLDNVVCP
jgi:hypothetical protein